MELDVQYSFPPSLCAAWRLTHHWGRGHRFIFLELVIKEHLSTEGPKSHLSLYALKSSKYLHSGDLASYCHCLPSLSLYNTCIQNFNIQKNIRNIFHGTWTSRRRKILKILTMEDKLPVQLTVKNLHSYTKDPSQPSNPSLLNIHS